MTAALVGITILSLFIVCGLFALVSVMIGKQKTGVPFLPIPSHLLEEILGALEIAPESVFYDLGCGDGRVVRSVAKSEPRARALGVELVFFPYMLARIRNFFHPVKNVVIRRANFNDISLSNATHIFLYLFPPVMDALLPKLESELRGARVVSCDFPFRNRAANRTILVKNEKHRAHTLYVYEF